MRILVVEDEPKTAAYLRKGLSEAGYAVDVACNGEDGLRKSLSEDFDLMLLDVQLPGRDGWTIVSRIRASGIENPVMFLTARDAVNDRVRGLELGADDYLVKPFAFSELLARIRTLLRRGPVKQSETLTIGDLEIDYLGHKVTRAGQRVDLTSREFLLLSVLARRESEVLTRTLLAEQVWDIHFDTDTNVVDVAIRRLRKKVDDPFSQPLIHTVRGVGYVLERRN